MVQKVTQHTSRAKQKNGSVGDSSQHETSPVIEAINLTLAYGNHQVVKDLNLTIAPRSVCALIGPSGCGKTTFLRCLNRMNDFIESFQLSGQLLYQGQDIYGSSVDPGVLRKRIGMVFQKPNPFARSIESNIAWGPSIHGFKGSKKELVRNSLEKAGLWDEVKDRLHMSGLALSGGQQQRLCIARAIAMNPDVILMDEPCASLDPISTEKIESLVNELKEQYTIVMVTHNMQQAMRIADQCAFMYQGALIEAGPTQQIFHEPLNPLTRDYVSGRFG